MLQHFAARHFAANNFMFGGASLFGAFSSGAFEKVKKKPVQVQKKPVLKATPKKPVLVVPKKLVLPHKEEVRIEESPIVQMVRDIAAKIEAAKLDRAVQLFQEQEEQKRIEDFKKLQAREMKLSQEREEQKQREEFRKLQLREDEEFLFLLHESIGKRH